MSNLVAAACWIYGHISYMSDWHPPVGGGINIPLPLTDANAIYSSPLSPKKRSAASWISFTAPSRVSLLSVPSSITRTGIPAANIIPVISIPFSAAKPDRSSVPASENLTEAPSPCQVLPVIPSQSQDQVRIKAALLGSGSNDPNSLGSRQDQGWDHLQTQII